MLKTAIVLLTYNHEEFIFDALEGIRNQTIQADEVIIAEDCSIDNTKGIICDYVKKFKLEDKWQLVFNNYNKGINLNLQNAVDLTTADIIIPMAGDDISLPNRCEVALDLFNKYPNLHIVATGVTKIDKNKNQIGTISYNNELFDDIKAVIIAGMPNVFPAGQNWRRSIFDKFGKLPLNIPNEDDQLTFRAILDQGIFCSSLITILYRVHSNSASAWLRNYQSDQEFFSRFTQDMDVRRLHMEHWKNTLSYVNRQDKPELLKLLELKIDLYNFFKHLAVHSFFFRIKFLIHHFRAVKKRELYYIIFGKLGVLSWRKIRFMIRG